MGSAGHHQKLSAAGLLVTLGIIFGDIGTSPLYVLSAIVGKEAINKDIILGGISCIFWTLTLQTTIKYVILTLRADNKGEGGIFSLYTLVRKSKFKWLIIAAMIGGSTLLADGIITPPVTISSAVEGLQYFNPHLNTVPIVIAIITLLFLIQQFGTKSIGKLFGPVMLIWFTMLGVLGFKELMGDWCSLKAINPYYAYELLQIHPEGIFVLGAVFLCTTGAEALYSDLGHCGKDNIRVSWIFVKVALLLNYFGQGAFLMHHEGQTLLQIGDGGNPFFLIMPVWFKAVGIIIATCAAIVASQALISGSFTLINEAIRLNLWPKVSIKYPSDIKGQLYIPSLNWLLLAGCIGVVLYFRKSANMEAAYGLAIVLTMISTTLLLNFYMILNRYNRFFVTFIVALYLALETGFLIANLSKFTHGGWITLLIAGTLFTVMTVWYLGKKIRNRYTEFEDIHEYIPVIKELSNDDSIPKYATHLVYMTVANDPNTIDKKILYSILQKRPKKADVYWLVHVDVVDEPYRMDYKVIEFAKDDLIRVDFKLGFRIAPKINKMFRQVVEDMVANGEIDITSRYESLEKNKVVGDFKFVVIEKYLSYDNELPFFEKVILNAYYLLKETSLTEEKAFGLDTSSVKVEKFPMVLTPIKSFKLKRVY
jgi:KUP system potassium uptake protein